MSILRYIVLLYLETSFGLEKNVSERVRIELYVEIGHIQRRYCYENMIQ